MELKQIKKSVIITGYRCNCNCKFCCNTHKRVLPDRTTKEILLEILHAYLRGITYLEIIGGEQTIRPDIFKIIGYAKHLGFNEIVMATNGRILSYKEFAERIIDAGLTEIIFSIHGHNARLHDYLTMVPGGFKQLRIGIENVKKINKCRIASNTTIVQYNYRYLYKIGKLIYDLGIRNAEFIFVDPTRGGAFDNFNELVPKISEVSPFAKKCLEIGVINKIPHWHIRYVPLCYFEGYENMISEIYEKNTFHTEHIALDFVDFDVQKSRVEIGRIKPDKCNGCQKFNLCEGIWIEYFKRYGDSELKPI